MTTIEYDLIFVRTGVEVLEAYLLADDLYWSTGARSPAGEPAYPQLTLGSLLLAIQRLHGRPLAAKQETDLVLFEHRLNEIQTRWRVAWERKSEREISARLKLWRDFLEDYRSNPENHTDRYAYEVNRRVMLELLIPFATNLPTAELDMLSGLDQLLHAVFVPGDFIWDAELVNSFPPQPYWYLYGNLRVD